MPKYEDIELEDVEEIVDIDEEELLLLKDDTDDDIFKIPKTRNKNKKEVQIYADPEALWEEVRKYYEQCDNEHYPDISPKLTKMLDDIATRIGYMSNFINYSFVLEMQTEARIKIFKSVRDHSFKLYSTTCIIKEIIGEDGKTIMGFYNKKKKYKERIIQDNDEIQVLEDGTKVITYKQNPFSYFTRCGTNAFINLIKKNALFQKTKEEYAEHIWCQTLASDAFAGVRRPKVMDKDDDSNDSEY